MRTKMDPLNQMQKCPGVALALQPCEPSQICFRMPQQCDQIFHRNDKYTACIYTAIVDDQISHSSNMLKCCCVSCLEENLTCLCPCQETLDVWLDGSVGGFLFRVCLLESSLRERTQRHLFEQLRGRGRSSVLHQNCAPLSGVSFESLYFEVHRRVDRARPR